MAFNAGDVPKYLAIIQEIIDAFKNIGGGGNEGGGTMDQSGKIAKQAAKLALAKSALNAVVDATDLAVAKQAAQAALDGMKQVQ